MRDVRAAWARERGWLPRGLACALVVMAGASACGDFDRSLGRVAVDGGASSGGDPGIGAAGGGADAEPDALYFEAEAAELRGGWTIGRSDAASGGEYIESTTDVDEPAAPGDGVARFEFELSVGGDYVVWGRTRGPDPTRNRYFVRVDAGPWIPWRLSTGDDFWWDDVHRDTSYGAPLVFSLASGRHTLEFGNSTRGAWLDRVYVTGRGDSPSGNDSPCNPPHSIRQGDTCVRACGTYGNTACGESECAGREAIAVYDCAVCCVLD